VIRRRKSEIIMRKEGGRLVPAAYGDREEIAALPEGQLVTVAPYKGTKKALAFLHAVLNRAEANAVDLDMTAEWIKVHVKRENGWIVGAMTEVDGVSYVTLKSTGDMSAEELAKFTEQVLLFCQEHVCPGVDLEAFKREARSDIEPAR
jgi:hypothetical protein